MSKQDLDRIIKRSYALGAEGLYDEEEELLRDALKKHPSSAELHRILAGNLINKNTSEAVSLIKKSVELAYDDPWNLTICGSFLYELDEKDLAFELSKKAASIASDNFTGWSILGHLGGLIARDMGKYELAEKAFITAFNDEPSAPKHGEELALLYYNTGRYKKALKVIDKTIDNIGKDPDLIILRDKIISGMKERYKKS